MRVQGIVDGVTLFDPESGEEQAFHRAGGLVFSFCDPENASARTLCHLSVRSGGQIVAREIPRNTPEVDGEDMAAVARRAEEAEREKAGARTAGGRSGRAKQGAGAAA